MSEAFSAELDPVSPFHQYDEDTSELTWDLAVFETFPEKNSEEPEPSPEELAAQAPAFLREFQDSRRMMVRMSLISGHQSGYKSYPDGYEVAKETRLTAEQAERLKSGGQLPRLDFVDEQREKEREERAKQINAKNLAFLMSGYKWPDERPFAMVKPKPITADVKRVAAALGASPEKLHLPHHIIDLPPAKLASMIEQVRARHAELEWDAQAACEITGLEPDKVRALSIFEIHKLIKDAKQISNEWDTAAARGIVKTAELAGGGGNLVEPAKLWNPIVHSLAPRNIGAMRNNNRDFVPYREPGAPEQPHLCGIRKTFKDQSGAKAAGEWKKLAEEGKIPNKITKCSITGLSLIERKLQCECGRRFSSELEWQEHQGRAEFPSKHNLKAGETWQIGPNVQGMGLAGAHIAVELAALRVMPQEVLQQVYGAEFVKGTSDRELPQLINQIGADPDAWAILAAHTNHPTFGKLAKVMLAWRDSLYLKLPEAEIREAERIGAKVAYELQQAYPEQFAKAVSDAGKEVK